MNTKKIASKRHNKEIETRAHRHDRKQKAALARKGMTEEEYAKTEWGKGRDSWGYWR